VNVGARFADPVVGVMAYDFGAHRVQVTAPHALNSPVRREKWPRCPIPMNW
jgi:hypothetical protein